MTVLTSLTKITRVSTIQCYWSATGVPTAPPPPSGENQPKIDQTGEGLAIQRKYFD